MTYYKKIGRLSVEEQAVVDIIEQIRAEKDIPISEIPICESLDDLLETKLLLEAYDSSRTIEDVDSETQIESNESSDVSTNDQDSTSDEIEIHDDGSDQNEVSEIIQKDEEIQEGIVAKTETDDVTEIIEGADEVLDENETLDFIADNYDPFAEEIIERSYNANDTNDSKRSDSVDESEDIDLEEAKSTPVDNLNPRTKKRAAEQTADTILKGYARIAPMPFKWLAKVDEQKVEQLAIEGQIDINIEVEPGMTFDEYMKQTNEQVDEVFEVEEETLNEIREPLVEVLMEQEMELTPQQRLMMAVVSHLFQMLTVALKLRKQNNRILQYQKQMTLQRSVA